MPKATYVHPDASETVLDIPVGESLMRAATWHGLDGILGDCGGGLACATCHVIVAPAFHDRLPVMTTAEDQMLDLAASPREPGSRLACQIKMTPALDGVIVRIADTQT